MGSRQAAFLYPTNRVPLELLSLDTFRRDLAASYLPEFTHVDCDSGEPLEAQTKKTTPLDIQAALKHGESFTMSMSSETMLVHSYTALCLEDPFVMLHWSTRMEMEWSKVTRKHFYSALRKAMTSMSSGYLVLIEDPSDYFYRKIVEIDKYRYYDANDSIGGPDNIRELWVNVELGATIVRGLHLIASPPNMQDGVQVYSVES